MSSMKRIDEKPFGGPRLRTDRRQGLAGLSLIVLALLLAACGSATEPASLPASTEAPAAETMVTPSVKVSDQEITDGKVTIAEVVSDGPGWLVIHAQADGKPGPILGYSAVAGGSNADVAVEIDAAETTETLYAMLHTDAGELGAWEFPDGPDAPVVVGDRIVSPAFAITGALVASEEIQPSVTVADQEILDGKVTIAEVVSDGPGWLVIHAQADGKPGPVLGYSAVAGGSNADLAVEIDAAEATETLYAMLHTDGGELGAWEFPNGPDAPAMVGDQIVSPTFAITGGLVTAEEIQPSVTVADQEILDGRVTIAEVVSDGPGWLVIHAQADGKPGPVLGYSAVAGGTNADLAVEIDAAQATETLYAMLHTDGGELGAWEFPDGPDAPVMVGDRVVTPAFAITGELAAAEEIQPSVTVADQEILDGKVTIAEVVSDGPGWLVIHAQSDGKPGPILGYSPVASGMNAALMVAIDAASATGTLYAMLHADAGELGAWEFPDGPDVPVMVGDQVITPAFKASKQAAAPKSSPSDAATPSSSAGSEIPEGAVVVTGDEAEVEMEDFKFNPKVLVIRSGATVKFANKDRAPHTATSDTGLFDSGTLSKGDEFFFTFTEPGTYPYYCIPHGGPGGQGMAATIIVQP